MGAHVHTLTFSTHIAVLDPVTGMGVLVLPDPVDSMGLLRLRCNGEAGDDMASRWFVAGVKDHLAVLRRLSGVGWELPVNNAGAAAWFDAGCTECCGRAAISLISVDMGEVSTPMPELLASIKVMQASASSACCSIGR